MALKINLIVLCFIISIHTVASTKNKFVYEFGAKGGSPVYNTDGYIGLLSWDTDIPIKVPSGAKIVYVRVTVHAVSSPKVDYDALTNVVSIKYSWTQLPISKYNIFALAV